MIENNSCNNEDLLLIMAIGRGDQQALSKLYDKYAPALTGIISRIVYKNPMVDEILQNVFQLVWNEAVSFDASRHSLFTWLIKITRQASIDKVRSAQVEISATSFPVYRHNVNKNETAGVEMQMFDLLFYKGLTCTDAAAVMKLPPDEIKKQVRLAIKNL